MPNRTLPFRAGARTALLPDIDRDRSPALIRRLRSSIGDRRRGAHRAEDAADLGRFDRALELIEHHTCDCV